MPLFGHRTPRMVDAASALPGRERELTVPARHFVLGTPPTPPPTPPPPVQPRNGASATDAGEIGVAGGIAENIEQAIFGMGCFWGAERLFWQAPGVYTTAVGYAGGYTPNPTYEEVCSGRTGHAEVVLVAFDPAVTSYPEMLRIFWEGHDPTQEMRQGNDVGTQYRSLILWIGDAQREQAQASRLAYQQVLSAAGHGEIATELVEADRAHPFYYAEDYHQQYLAKNPGGYCGLGGTGVSCPVGLSVSVSTAGERSARSSQ